MIVNTHQTCRCVECLRRIYTGEMIECVPGEGAYCAECAQPEPHPDDVREQTRLAVICECENYPMCGHS